MTNDYKFDGAFHEKLGFLPLDDIIENYVDNNTGRLKKEITLLCPECKDEKARLNLQAMKYLKLYSGNYSHPKWCSFYHKTANKKEMNEYDENVAQPKPENVERMLARLISKNKKDLPPLTVHRIEDNEGINKNNDDTFETSNNKTRRIAQQKIGYRNILDEFDKDIYKYYYGDVFIDILTNENFLNIKVKNFNKKTQEGKPYHIFQISIRKDNIPVLEKLKSIASGKYKLAVYGKLSFGEKKSNGYEFKTLWVNKPECILLETIDD